MKIVEVTSQMKQIAILPGRFQPPHKGHIKTWNTLKERFGTSYIATSNIVNETDSLFTFAEKKQLFMSGGVPDRYIIKTRSPYRAREILDHYDPATTVAIYAVSEKDMLNEDARFSFNNNTYFKRYEENVANLRPVLENSYIMTVPTIDFNLDKRKAISATEFRQRFVEASFEEQEQLIYDIYETYDPAIHELIANKLCQPVFADN